MQSVDVIIKKTVWSFHFGRIVVTIVKTPEQSRVFRSIRLIITRFARYYVRRFLRTSSVIQIALGAYAIITARIQLLPVVVTRICLQLPVSNNTLLFCQQLRCTRACFFFIKSRTYIYITENIRIPNFTRIVWSPYLSPIMKASTLVCTTIVLSVLIMKVIEIGFIIVCTILRLNVFYP